MKVVLCVIFQTYLQQFSIDKEHLEDSEKYIRESGLGIIGQLQDDWSGNAKLVIPYIKFLSETINQWFNDLTTKMCYTTSIFDPKIQHDKSSYGAAEIVNLASLHSSLSLPDLQDEWKTFRNYLKVQAEKKPWFSGKDILQKLAAHDNDLADTFPQLSVVASCQDHPCVPSWHSFCWAQFQYNG